MFVGGMNHLGLGLIREGNLGDITVFLLLRGFDLSDHTLNIAIAVLTLKTPYDDRFLTSVGRLKQTCVGQYRNVTVKSIARVVTGRASCPGK